MDDYDHMSISSFARQMLRRWDGIAALLVCALFLGLTFAAYVFELQIGKLAGGKLAVAAILSVPTVLLFYVSLAYYSADRAISVAINSLLLIATPFVFLYLLY